MNRLALKVGVLLALNAVAGWWWLAESRDPEPCARWETDANLDVMPRDTAFRTVIAGSSHGWALTACPGNAQATYETLGADTHNLSKQACGPLPTLCYLEEFYARGNRADALIYFVDPWAVAYPEWNEDALFLYNEPFDSGFLLRCLRNGINPREIAAALRNHFKPREDFGAERITQCERVLDRVNPESVQRRLNFLYPTPYDPAAVQKYAPTVESIVRVAESRDTRVLIVIPPTLLGDMPGMDTLRTLLTKLDDEREITWLDLSEAIAEPSRYQDHDHLNAEGTRTLIVNHILPALARPGA